MSAAQRMLERTQSGTAVRAPAVPKRFAKSARRASASVKRQQILVQALASRTASAVAFSPVFTKTKRNVSAAAVAAPGAKTSTSGKTVYLFGKDISEGNASMRLLLGGKGANLAEMANLGINVPPGFTLTTDTCAGFHTNGRQLPPGCWEDVLKAVKVVEKHTGFTFGSSDRPLLLSVRSGAAVSMPGMMDTVLNLGNNDTVVEAMAAKAGARFAYDSYRRFLEMFGNVVMGIDRNLFEKQLHHLKGERGVEEDTALTADDMKILVARFKEVYRSQGMEFPQDPFEQLKYSIYAVFDSWNSDRAIVYRQVSGISGYKGTAVNVQAMVFGNMGETSGTGVCFTRDPKNGDVMMTKGKRDIWGEYLVNAQGEDVVAGIRTPSPISVMAEELPAAHKALVDSCIQLEKHFKDMQDVEFTVQEGQLYVLQCRGGKRAGRAAVKIATDLVTEGLVAKADAVLMVEAGHLDELLLPQFEDVKAYKKDVIGKGLDASPGAAVGQAVFTAAKAEEWKAAGLKVVLIRKDTSPEDVKGMYSAEGVLTALGGQTSHAAVVARGWGKPCVSGCKELQVDEEKGVASLNGHVIHEGNWVSINGSTGEIIKGKQPLTPAELSKDSVTFLKWVDEYRTMKVLTNADTPKDAMTARNFGAEGIGLVRTEHMFFESADRIKKMRRMIVAPTVEARKAALDSMLEFQRKDFEGIFTAMDGFPVTIRMLDPPLHEFMQENEINEICAEMSKEYGLPAEAVLATVDALHETNPMLGFRGCRLGIAYPDITEMQARAIFEAAVSASKKGVKVQPDVMVPLVGTVDELKHQATIIRRVAGEVFKKAGSSVPFRVGTMIEVPRAALMAGEIAQEAEFFSFGTNDLTQMTFGYSRDDAGKFVPLYIKNGILPSDPFQELDIPGVGQLIKMATTAGRASRPDLKVGLCGEQGGHPNSVEFLAEVGLDYVSCSPFRVPGARLAAAQAAIKKGKPAKK